MITYVYVFLNGFTTKINPVLTTTSQVSYTSINHQYTFNQEVVSISANGLVTPRKPGDTKVMVTYKEFIKEASFHIKEDLSEFVDL